MGTNRRATTPVRAVRHEARVYRGRRCPLVIAPRTSRGTGYEPSRGQGVAAECGLDTSSEAFLLDVDGLVVLVVGDVRHRRATSWRSPTPPDPMGELPT